MSELGRLEPGAASFRVTELPAYEPCGAGEHLWIEIEKEDLTTDAVVDALAAACGRAPRDVGFAGRKDRHGVTRQWFSTPETVVSLIGPLFACGSASV